MPQSKPERLPVQELLRLVDNLSPEEQEELAEEMKFQWLRPELAKGEESLARGEGIPGDEVFRRLKTSKKYTTILPKTIWTRFEFHKPAEIYRLRYLRAELGENIGRRLHCCKIAPLSICPYVANASVVARVHIGSETANAEIPFLLGAEQGHCGPALPS